MTEASDRTAIHAVIMDYLEGMVYGEPERLRRAMHPLCMQAGHYKGSYEFFPRDEFIEGLKAEPKLPAGTRFRHAIVSLDITGDTAVAKVTDECFGTFFTDYLTLIRHDGRWQIVMKAFYDHANAAAA